MYNALAYAGYPSDHPHYNEAIQGFFNQHLLNSYLKFENEMKNALTELSFALSSNRIPEISTAISLIKNVYINIIIDMINEDKI